MDDSYTERFKSFEEHGLGLLKDNTVRLVSHNCQWQTVFSNEANFLSNSLHIKSLRLFHCGSTSIPGIVAKPIIDIIGSVASLDEVDQKKELFEAIGYEFKGEYGIKGRRYSVLSDPEKNIGYCHLHIFSEESTELSDHILFRDYLRRDKTAAQRYESVKKSLKVSRDLYSNKKSEVINELLIEARTYDKL